MQVLIELKKYQSCNQAPFTNLDHLDKSKYRKNMHSSKTLLDDYIKKQRYCNFIYN